jgi:hypothetical protein
MGYVQVGLLLCMVGLMMLVPAVGCFRGALRRERWYGMWTANALFQQRELAEMHADARRSHAERIQEIMDASDELERRREELERTQRRGRVVDAEHRPFTLDEVQHYARELEQKQVPNQATVRMAVIRHDLTTDMMRVSDEMLAAKMQVDYIEFSLVRYATPAARYTANGLENREYPFGSGRHWEERSAWVYTGPVLVGAVPWIVRYYNARPPRGLGEMVKRAAEESGYRVPVRPEELERAFEEMIMRGFMVPLREGRWPEPTVAPYAPGRDPRAEDPFGRMPPRATHPPTPPAPTVEPPQATPKPPRARRPRAQEKGTDV